MSGGQTTVFIVLMLILLPTSFFLIKNTEPSSVRRLVCPESWSEYKEGTTACHRLLRSSCRCRHCLLWPDNLSRPRSAPYMPWTLPYVQSCYDTSGIVALGALSLALLCNLIARMPGFEGALPVNSVTALVGAPVVMWVLFNKRRSEV